jgi:hypothetical protein
MAKVTISGIPQLNGEYPLSLDGGFTHRELHTIKQVSGVRLFEVSDAIRAGDQDFFLALGKIALDRAGRGEPSAYVLDLLWDSPAGSVVIDFSEDEEAGDDAGPPVSQSSSDAPESGSDVARSASAGSDSSTSSDVSPETSPASTGSPH